MPPPDQKRSVLSQILRPLSHLHDQLILSVSLFVKPLDATIMEVP